jgi:sortase A
MRDKRIVDELSIEELEHILVLKRQQARAERLKRLTRDRKPGAGMFASLKRMEEPEPAAVVAARAPASDAARASAAPAPERKTGPFAINFKWVRDSTLLILELVALAGLVVVLLASVFNLQVLNEEVALAREPTPTFTPTPQVQIQLSVLPGGHSPPTTTSSVPQRLADRVQPVVPAPIPTPGPQSATRIVIESINVDAVVVEGDDWEQLKKGAGHHIGSANPGERGNCFISAHNDIFGEIFRRLEDVELEDEIIVYAGETPYRYVAKAKRIIDPDDVSVMAPTANPVLTLMTCYPYMIDTHRLIVIAELAE